MGSKHGRQSKRPAGFRSHRGCRPEDDGPFPALWECGRGAIHRPFRCGLQRLLPAMRACRLPVLVFPPKGPSFSRKEMPARPSRDTGTKTVAASPVFEVENDVLKPSYDAAHVALKGLWRLPTKEEFSLLVTGTTNSFADGGMTFSGAGQTMFLPATVFLSATTHVQPGTYTCYGQPIRPVFSIAF